MVCVEGDMDDIVNNLDPLQSRHYKKSNVRLPQ